MLAVFALLLAQGYREKLIGASASGEVEDRIQRWAVTYPPVRDVRDVTTMVVGPERLLAHLTIKVDPKLTVEELGDITAQLERKLMRRIPELAEVYIEVIADDEPVI